MKRIIPLLVLSLLACRAEPFTYQGRLSDNGAPASGNYDFRFTLFDSVSNGLPIGLVIDRPAVNVAGGQFLAELDFGPGVFIGSPRWLEIAVRPGGSAADYVILNPRQPLTAAPYASYAGSASNLLGTITDSQLPATAARLNGNQNFTGTPTFNPLFGPPFVIGSTNTNRVASLNADLLDGMDAAAFARSNHTHTALDVTSGTLNDARLSANVPLLSDHQTFVGSNIFRGVVIATNPANVLSGSASGLSNLNAAALTGSLPQSVIPNNVARLASNQTFSGSVVFAPATGAPFAVISPTLVTNLNADQLDGLSSAAFWNTLGNSNAAGGFFVGTIDNSPLDLRVNSARAMRIQPHLSGPTIVAGSAANSAATNSGGIVIAGGNGNTASNSYSAVLGGSNNRALAANATVAGGIANSATNTAAIVLGGSGNTAGGAYSVAAGRNARALHDGSFVFADSSSLTAFTSSAPHQLVVRASGGVGIGTNAPQSELHVAGTVEASGLKLTTAPSAGAYLTSDAAGNAAWIEAPVRIQTNGTSPNIIAGYTSNTVAPGVVGAAIGGGGSIGRSNFVSGNYGTIAGGFDNRVLTLGGAVAGGTDNATTGDYGAVGGGAGNTAAERAVVAGGQQNAAIGLRSAIGGGYLNRASGQESVVAGGLSNNAVGLRAFIGGGNTNIASGSRSTIGGGDANIASGSFSTIGGGAANTNTGTAASVAGGQNNAATSLGAAVPGGAGNVAAGQYSFAAGRNARALHDGAFVWADNSSAAAFSSTSNHQFMIRAAGGVGIGGAPGDAMLDVEGDTRINDRDLLLRSGIDRNAGLGWRGAGRPFAGVSLDGPALYGFNGGLLGTRQGGAEQIALAWNTNRQVSIGTMSPIGGFHVRYDSSAGDVPQITVEQAAAGNRARIRFLNPGQARWDITAGGSSNALSFNNGVTGDIFTIYTNGFTGIGTAPVNPLSVVGYGTSVGGVAGVDEVIATFNGLGAAAAAVNAVFFGDPAFYLSRNNSAVWGWHAIGTQLQVRYEPGAATHMVINSGGSIGIGTVSPTDRLTVANGLRVDATDQNSGTKFNGVRFGGDSTGEAIGSQRTSGTGQYGLDFYTGHANRMHIAADGDVGVGTRSPAAKLDVQGSVKLGVNGTTMNNVQSGTATVGAGSGFKTITVIFPASFSTTPKVMVTVKGQDFDDTFAVTTRAVNNVNFKLNVLRVDAPGGGWAQNLLVDWMAWE
jgi:hypothetical protein